MTTSEPITIYECSHIGVAGTTAAHVRHNQDGTYTARIGIAIMGSTNMDEAGFAACDHNPFHNEFYDNFSEGHGKTEEEALMAMKIEMQKLSASIWEI